MGLIAASGRNLTSTNPPNQRLLLLDALRGLALFGVLLVNLRYFSLYELLTAEQRSSLPSADWDAMLRPLMAVFVDGKAITLFTLLFGIGMALQLQRSADMSAGRQLLLRRMVWLLLIGLIHGYLLWWGEILRYYAVLGLLLIPLLRWSPRTLAITGGLMVMFGPALLRWLLAGHMPERLPSQFANDIAVQGFSDSSLWIMLSTNIGHDLWLRQGAVGLLAFILGRFMLGVALANSGVLWDIEQHQLFWRRLCLWCWLLGLMLTLFFIARSQGLIVLGGDYWRWPATRIVLGALRHAASVSLALAYLATFVLINRHRYCLRLSKHLAVVGRMALSNYLLQTLFGIGLFYGVGLGLGPDYGMPAVILATVVIFAIQIMVSHWWLRSHRQGPAEWLWRWAYARPVLSRKSTG
ncbi:MAG: DUF418 domain-containing protein [Wenzhouxiangellaceae bacterium]